MSPYATYIVETSITLVVVCGLAALVLVFARRLGLARPSGAIELVGQLPLDARRAIYVVRIGAHVFVVGAGEGGLTKLGELPLSAVPPRGEPPPRVRFSDALAKVLGRASLGTPRPGGAPPEEPRAAEPEVGP